MNRKEFIQNSLFFSAGVVVTGLSGCSLFDEKKMKAATEAEVKEKGFVVKTFNRKEIFITYLEEKLTIFSLICRHKKCTVKYNNKKEQFICPCHDGTYDKTGKVVSGPPPSPLRRFQYEIRNGEIWVLNQWIG